MRICFGFFPFSSPPIRSSSTSDRSIVTETAVFVVGSVLRAPEEFQHVDHDSSRERIMVLASAVLQVHILFMVDHLVSGQVHQRVHALCTENRKRSVYNSSTHNTLTYLKLYNN